MDQVNNWHATYQELNRVIGKVATLKLYKNFGGMQVTFPKRLFDKGAEARMMHTEFDQGMSLTQIAKKHHYSEKSVRRILRTS